MCTREETRKEIKAGLAPLEKRIEHIEGIVEKNCKTIERIARYHEKMLPALESLSEIFTGGKFANRVITFLAKMLGAIGVIAVAILWLKEWFKS